MSSKTSGVKSIYICNDPTGAKIQERAEEHIQTSKFSNIITTSYYRVPAVPRIAAYNETTSTEALQDDVDALDEARDVALARATQYQQNQRNYHSSRVRPRSFVVGDLVLRLKQDGHGKLESPWVGPYIVTEVIPGGAYRLQDKKTGKDERNPWNAEQLWRFYA
jgi:hypothetical protein